jgi:RNA polymerase sigma-70 factor (ECF subfamily)
MSGSVSEESLAGKEVPSRPSPNESAEVIVTNAPGSSDGRQRAKSYVGRPSMLARSNVPAPISNQLVSRAVKRAQAGDRQALGFLYAHYADNVYGYVCSIVHDRHEAEDVTQHVFAKLIHVIGKYEEREVPFFAWILRVARNVAVDHIRGQRLVPVEEVRTSDEGGGDPAGSGCMRDLTDALSMLPHDQREVLVMRHFAGFSPPEIAERTGRTVGSIHGLHHRGRRALRADLKARGMAPGVASLTSA